MAGRGPAPKPEAERARTNATLPMTKVEATGDVFGPDLPEVADGWPALTRRWWQTWRTSAQAAVFTGTDWDFLLETALIHAAFVDGNYALAGELRLRVAKFGATPEDRARLRLQVVPPGAEKVEPRQAGAAVTGRKDRLLKAVQ